MIYKIFTNELNFPVLDESEKLANKTVVIGLDAGAFSAREIAQKVRASGGISVGFSPKTLSPTLADELAVVLFTDETLFSVTGIKPEGEAYTCLALKKAYRLGVKRAVIFFENETVLADGQTLSYCDETNREEVIRLCDQRLRLGEKIAQ